MNFGKLLFFTILAVGIITPVLYWQQARLPFKLPALPNISSLPQINQLSQNQQLQSASKQAQTQLQATGEKFQTAASNTQKILGAAVQVNDKETKTGPEKALDYGKYLYCKQVVNDYEKQILSLSTPIPANSPVPPGRDSL